MFGEILNKLFGFHLFSDFIIINSDAYCHLLHKLNNAFQQKRPEVINRQGVLHQDKA